MKPVRLLPFLTVLLLISCIRTEPERESFPGSAVDNLPFSIEAHKDPSVHPGDDFYRYCLGSWLSSAAIPAGKKITGLGIMEASDAMKEVVNELYETDPVLQRIDKDIAAMHSKPEVSLAYVQRIIDEVPAPENTSQEEYIRLMGKLQRRGIKGFVTLMPIPTGNQYFIDVMPWLIFHSEEDQEELTAEINRRKDLNAEIPVRQLGPLTKAPAREGEKVLFLLAEGLGMDPSFLALSEANEEQLDNYAQDYLHATPQRLYDAIVAAIKKDLLPYVDEASMKAAGTSMKALDITVSSYVDYLVNYRFAKTYVSSETEAGFTAYCEEIREQFRKHINRLDWMSPASKAKAIEKLDAMKINVGEPDNWIMESIATLEELEKCTCFVEEVNLLYSQKIASVISMAGKDKKEYSFNYVLLMGNSLSAVNAFYTPSLNSIFILPGIFLPPMIPSGETEARTYAVFYVIGHEMTHGFDQNGSQYDKDGNKSNWMTVADRMNFEERLQILADCYSHLEVSPEELPGTYCDGEHTLSENTADLGGFSLALDAYTDKLTSQGFYGEQLRIQLRKFFESYAFIWCEKYDAAYIKSKTEGKQPDVHALSRERVNGVVMNTDAWYQLYNVDRNRILYLPPERRSKIW